jgi:prophage regulatory protein
MKTSDSLVTALEREAAMRVRAGVRIMGEPEVEERTSLSRVTRWRLEREGKFPQRLRLAGNRVGWLAEEIVAWIESRPRGAA